MNLKTNFLGHIRPTAAEFKTIWNECEFAFDANVLLNLYRYTSETEEALKETINSILEKVFLPHQAAKEFFRNRLNVTAGQANEYESALKALDALHTKLTNNKKHPYIEGDIKLKFTEITDEISTQLHARRDAVLKKLHEDEILNFIIDTFNDKTGPQSSQEEINNITTEGASRYTNEIPPGYKDGKKDNSGDPHRKFGDLIIWKQLINRSIDKKKPIIFITDDKKEDWWLEQSGRTIGPRPELRDEFFKLTQKNFWMYTVDKFMEEAAQTHNKKIDEKIIQEIVDVSVSIKTEETPPPIETSPEDLKHRVITNEDLLEELAHFSELHKSQDDSVSLRQFVANHLGKQNYEINHSYAKLNTLAELGRVEIFKRDDYGTPLTRVRICPKLNVEPTASS